jgi:hypothetical protein
VRKWTAQGVAKSRFEPPLTITADVPRMYRGSIAQMRQKLTIGRAAPTKIAKIGEKVERPPLFHRY